MSLRTKKDNIFFILPEDRYSISKKVDEHMANDFTLFIKAKINNESLEKDKTFFLFSRNGQHSGINIFKNEYDELFATFCWWVQDLETQNDEYQSVMFKIKEETCIWTTVT